MNAQIKNILKLILSVSIGIFLIWYIQKDLTSEQIQMIILSIKNIKISIVVMVMFLGILACYIRAWRWKLLLEPMGYSPPNSLLVSSIFIMYLANLAFPRLGEVLRCSILAKYNKVPIEKSIGTMVLERLVDMAGMGLIAFIALVLEFDKFLKIYETYTQNKQAGNSYFLYFGLLVFISLIFGFYFLRNSKIILFIKAKIMGFSDGFQSIRKIKSLKLFIFYSVLIYSIYFLSTYLFYFAITGTEFMTFKSTFLTLTAGTLGIGMTQGGIGAFQLLVTKALELYNIPNSVGLAYSWSSWLVQTSILVLAGIISWIYISIKKYE